MNGKSIRCLFVLASLLSLPLLVMAVEDPPPEGEESVDHIYHRGLNLLKNRSYEKAEAAFGKLLAREPGFVLAVYCRGVCRLGLGRFEDALRDFDAFLKVRPGSAKALALRGRAHLALGRYAPAEADLSAALGREPGNRGWTWDLEQTRMLKRGNATSGEGKPFPSLTFEAAHKRGDLARWRVSKGHLVPLLSAVAKVEKTLRDGPAYRRLLLLFLPSAEHPLDIARLSEVSEYLPAIEKRGLAVAAVFPDPPDALWRVKEGKGLAFPMFSDPEGRGAWQLGILNTRFREVGTPLATLFFVDKKGTIRIRRTALDPGRRTPIEKILQEIDRLCKKEVPPGEKKEERGDGGK
ncbi:MAG: tetratricopeptide repeat protein [Planctomycetota bacterium]|jgi:tetratricopeptide (TPR) repeat protein